MQAASDNINLFNQDFYERIAEKVADQLKSYSNIQHYEIYCNGNQDTKIIFEEGEIKEALNKTSGGLGLRVIDSQGCEGTTFTSDFADSSIEIIVSQAVASDSSILANHHSRHYHTHHHPALARGQ